MKPPKNFYSNLDRRKQGLPEVPEASAADVGKIVKVGEDGDYVLGNDSGTVLPDINPATDETKMIQVTNGAYALTNDLLARSFIVTDTNRKVISVQGTSYRVTEQNNGSMLITFLERSATINSLTTTINTNGVPVYFINKERESFFGTLYSATSTSVSGVIRRVSDKNLFNITLTANSYELTPIGSIKYYEITASGSSVSLPSGVTFADVYAELQAGVDVKFTSGARVYSVTSFESTNIRAHWMSDLDLTSMEVYVINIASDGTGTVASATFSGS